MSDTRSIAYRQNRHRIEERIQALRALLMTPLMTSAHADFSAVRRHADELRLWFSRETGWTLQISRGLARLYKHPANLHDDSRGLPGYEKRHYVLICLVCAVLERADAQITLRMLGERLLSLAASSELAQQGFRFELSAAYERRELVKVCRSLLEWGVLKRMAGDEQAYIEASTHENSDALYDVQRPLLAAVLAAVRGPSTWPDEQAPLTLEERIQSLVQTPAPDSAEGQRTALRHYLARRLLDDPVVYLDDLDEAARAYFSNQRGSMAKRLCEASGLSAEQRAEGLALVDEDSELTDVAMPAEGTDAHATLLVAEFLAKARAIVSVPEVVAFLAEARERYGRYWKKAAREPGAELELARIALSQLQKLQLIRQEAQHIHPLPALSRFSLEEIEVREPASSTTLSLFDD